MKIRNIILPFFLLTVHFYTIIDASSWGIQGAVVSHYIVSLIFIAVGSLCVFFSDGTSKKLFRIYCFVLLIFSAAAAAFRLTKTFPYTLHEIVYYYVIPPFYGFRPLGGAVYSLVSLAVSSIWLTIIKLRSAKEETV